LCPVKSLEDEHFFGFNILITSSENFPPRPNAHEVSRCRAVTGKKRKVESVVVERFIIWKQQVVKELDLFIE
jgi:hypothetical protein